MNHQTVAAHVTERMPAADPARWLLAVAGDWAQIGAALLLWRWCYLTMPDGPWGWVLIVPVGLLVLTVLGARQHALGVAGHDAAHRLVARNKRLNDWLGDFLTLYPILASVEGYREFHFQHHKHTGTDQDPEYAFRRAFGLWDLPVTRRQLALRVFLALVGLRCLPALFLGAGLVPRTAGGLVRLLASWALVIGLLAWEQQLWILGPWWAARLTTFWLFFELRVWTEHIGTAETHVIAATFWQKYLFLPHNTWCHAEHHLCPQVPFHALPALRRRRLAEGVAVHRVGELFAGHFASARRQGGAPARPAVACSTA